MEQRTISSAVFIAVAICAAVLLPLVILAAGSTGSGVGWSIGLSLFVLPASAIAYALSFRLIQRLCRRERNIQFYMIAGALLPTAGIFLIFLLNQLNGLQHFQATAYDTLADRIWGAIKFSLVSLILAPGGVIGGMKLSRQVGGATRRVPYGGLGIQISALARVCCAALLHHRHGLCHCCARCRRVCFRHEIDC